MVKSQTVHVLAASEARLSERHFGAQGSYGTWQCADWPERASDGACPVSMGALRVVSVAAARWLAWPQRQRASRGAG